MAKLVKNPLQQRIVRMLLLYCIFFIIELWDRQFWWLFCVIWLTWKDETLCWASGRCVIEGERGGWMKVAFGHLCILLPMPGCWTGTSLVQSFWGLHCWSPAASQLPHMPTAVLHLPACASDTVQEEDSPRRNHCHIVLKKPTLSPQGQREEETSKCLCHLSDKAFLLPSVYTYWAWNGPAMFCCSLPHGPHVEDKDWVCGAPANAELVLDAALGCAGKKPGHRCTGCNRR